ncbi:LysR family transcriptional regulator [Limosilactobacillus fermentum]|uniref:LysR family transcriptional regulator n=1 Tax=Limosilactobacillus fermentum TaxID=1613 RepID=UPI0022E445DE|nr:LysR family transcriptional regulator [Limosilactobacillus fermentum]
MRDPDLMLNYLEVLLKHSNFTKAASELYISQPYLTQLIKRIEKELGAPIINRHRLPFSLTEAGQIYYQYLENLSAEHQRLALQLARYTNDSTEIIRVAVLESLGTFLLPEILPRFLKDHPSVRIQVVEGFPHQSEERILNDQADLYMGQTPETLNYGIHPYINGGENYYVIIPATSKFYQPGRFILDPSTYNLDDLLQEPFVLSSAESEIRHQVNSLFQNRKLVPKVVMVSNSVITVANLAIQGVGLTISAASILKRIKETPINLYPLDPSLIQIRYFIGAKKDRPLTDAMRDLIAAFQSANLQMKIH